MEIKFRAERIYGRQKIEQDFNTIPELKMNGGYVFEIDPETLEIVIDGQAVKVAEIKKLMILKAQIGHLLKLVTSDRNDADVVRDINKFMNNLEDKDND